MRLSFVVPLYNEEKRIGNSIQEVQTFRAKLSHESEWIFVDDGSTDRTKSVAEPLLESIPHRWIRLESNQGKGRAVQRGMLEARGDVIIFMDADLSTPLTEYEKLVNPLKNGYDIAIGSRGPGARILVRQNPLRETMGKLFNRIARALTFKEIRDSQCGFKAFRREVVGPLFSSQKIFGFSFDAEILFLAQQKGFRIAEVPVTWVNSKESRVRVLRDSFRMFVDLFRIRWLHRNLNKRKVGRN